MQDSQSTGAVSTVLSLVPVVLGGVLVHFKMFVGSLDEFRNKIELFRKSHIEKTALQHTTLLKHASAVGILRGDGKEEPDYIGDYESDAFRRITIFHKLEMVRIFVRLGFDVVFFTIALGVVSTVLSFFFPSMRFCLSIVGGVLIGLQLLSFYCVFRCSKFVHLLEDTT